MSPVTGALPEAQVLKTLSPEIAAGDENDWPEFRLSNVIVADENGNLATVFDCGKKQLTLAGKFKRRKDENQYYTKPMKNRSVMLAIYPIERFSIAEDNSDVTIWAAGSAGWYIIEPADVYSDVYKEMVEGVRALYLLYDTKKLLKSPPTKVFDAYAKKYKVSSKDAESLFLRHAELMMSQLPTKFGTEWSSKKPLYQFLQRHLKEMAASPEQVKKQMVKIPSASPEPEPPQPKSRSRHLKTVPPSQPRASEQCNPATALENLKWRETEAAILWTFVIRYSEEAVKPKHLNLQRLSVGVFGAFEFLNKTQAYNYIRFQAPYLVKYMQERRQRKIWINSPLYSDLTTTELGTQVRNRMAEIHLATREFQLENELIKEGVDRWESSEEEVETPHAKKGGLRPRSAGKKGKSYTAWQGGSQGGGDESDEDGVSTKKRKHTDDIGSRTHKRRALSTSNSSEGSSYFEGSPVGHTQELPLRQKREGDDFADVPAIVKGTTFRSVANGEGDTWHCQAPDCRQTIYGASESLGQKLIEEHIETHQVEEEQAPQMDVIMREMMKTNLPVANLIKRIREFSAATELADTVAGAENPEFSRPQPIRRIFT